MSVRRWLWSAVAATVVVVAGVVALVLWPASPAPQGTAEPRARQYRDIDVCLLADSAGVSTEPARAVWTGMQDASVQTNVRVSYVALPGKSVPDVASSYVASLVNRRCWVIVAAGDGPPSAVERAAPAFSAQRFVVVGADSEVPNVLGVPLSVDLRVNVRGVVLDAISAVRGR